MNKTSTCFTDITESRSWWNPVWKG